MFFLSPYPCPLDKWARKVTHSAGTPLVPDNWTYPAKTALSCLLSAKDTSPRGTSVPQLQKFHTDDIKSVWSLLRNSDWLM